MQMTEAGLALIRQFEGFRGTAYRCPGGIWTIGYGHTAMAGPPDVAEGQTMTEADAGALLKADADKFAEGVKAALTRELSDAQFSALVSFAYNVGLGAFKSSSVLKAVNAGGFETVPRRLQLWVKGGGRVLPGLVKRRAAEADLFMSESGKAEETGVPVAIDGKPAFRSTSVLAALVAAITSVISGTLGAASGAGMATLLAGAAGLAAAIWIIRERLLKSREDGV